MTKRERLIWEVAEAKDAARHVSGSTIRGQALHRLVADAEYVARTCIRDEAITEPMIREVVRAASRFDIAINRMARALRAVVDAPKRAKTESD